MSSSPGQRRGSASRVQNTPAPTALNLPKLVSPIQGVTCHPALSLEMRRLGQQTSGGSSNDSTIGSSGSESDGVKRNSGNSSAGSNVRSLVSKAFIPRGSVLATIPARFTLRGATSHDMVRQMLGAERYRKLLDFAASRDRHEEQKTAAKNKDIAGSSLPSSSSSALEKKSKNTFISLSSRDCIMMLCALASARVFVAQQRHMVAASIKAKAKEAGLPPTPSSSHSTTNQKVLAAKSHNNNNSNNISSAHGNNATVKSNTTPLNSIINGDNPSKKETLPQMESFTALRIVSPPPQWLLHWCKFGLPAKAFAAGIAVVESQELKMEKVERRRLNVIQDPRDVLAFSDGGGEEEREGDNMGFFPSPVPSAGYLGPSVPETLLDASGTQLPEGAAITISTNTTSRIPHMAEGNGLALTANGDGNNSNNLNKFRIAAAVPQPLSLTTSTVASPIPGSNGSGPHERDVDGSSRSTPVQPSPLAYGVEPATLEGVKTLKNSKLLAKSKKGSRINLEGAEGGSADSSLLTEEGNPHQEEPTAALVDDENDDTIAGKPPLLRALERVASGKDRQVIGDETRFMMEAEDALEKAQRAMQQKDSLLNNDAGVTSHTSAAAASSTSDLSVIVSSSSNTLPTACTAGEGPTSVEPFAPNRTRDLVEVVATPSMVAKFLRDEPLVLSEAKQRMLVAHKYGERAGLEELALRSAALDTQLLRPIAKILVGASQRGVSSSEADTCKSKGSSQFEDDEDEKDCGQIMEDLRWAHAMLRSRAVNANWPSTGRREGLNASNPTQNESNSSNNAAYKIVEPSLIPVVDLLNHAPHGEANATFIPAAVMPTNTSAAASGGTDTSAAAAATAVGFNVVATRDIHEGEMISLYYGHYRQRVILFEEDPALAAEELANAVARGGMGTGAGGSGVAPMKGNGGMGSHLVDLSNVPNAARERLAVSLDMKRIEDLQRFGNTGGARASSSKNALGFRNGNIGGGEGYIDDDALNDVKTLHRDPRAVRRRLDESVTEKYFVQNAVEAARSSGGGAEDLPERDGDSEEASRRGTAIRDTSKSITVKKFSGLTDADWSWNFGFAKSEEEKHSESRKQFEKNLNRRVAGMVSPARKGRKGEFVVGVPPGLKQLQEHRARLQQDQYGGHAVFPPQRV